MDIDLVCFYEDHEDQIYQNLKTVLIEKNLSTEELFKSSHVFLNPDFLKYVLRSVEQHAKFIRNIYIITNSSLPKWLNFGYSKIQILSYKSIVPSNLLPTYNYSIVEQHIVNIPTLSEHFLYMPENVFFIKDVDQNFFFDNHYRPYIRFKDVFCRDRKLKYKKYAAIRNSIDICERYFDVRPRFFKHCNIEAFYRKDIVDCLGYISDEINKMSTRFASDDDVSRYIWTYYSYIKKRSVLKYPNLYMSSSFTKIFTNILLNFMRDSQEIKLSQKKYKLSKNAKMFSFNKNSKATEKDEERAMAFLEKLFPKKAEFEF